MRNVLVFLLLFVLLFNKTIAQNENLDEDYPVHIDLGVGIPLVLGKQKSGFNEKLVNKGFSELNTIIGVYWNIDFRVSDKFRIGFTAGYNIFKFEDKFFNPNSFNYIFNADTIASIEKVTLLNLTSSVKFTYLFFNSDRFIGYGGFLAGYSFWDDDPPLGYVNIGTQYSVPDSNFSFLIIGGVKWFFSNNVGIYAEVGYGSGPFLLNGGITTRLSLRKFLRAIPFGAY